MAFDPEGRDARLAALLNEVGKRWRWEADVVESIVPDQLAIVREGLPIGYIDLVNFVIVEYDTAGKGS